MNYCEGCSYNKNNICILTGRCVHTINLDTEEYIKKSDLMKEVILEEMSDFTEWPIVYVDDINNLPTYTFPKIERVDLNGKT